MHSSGLFARELQIRNIVACDSDQFPAFGAGGMEHEKLVASGPLLIEIDLAVFPISHRWISSGMEHPGTGWPRSSCSPQSEHATRQFCVALFLELLDASLAYGSGRRWPERFEFAQTIVLGKLAAPHSSLA
jgi:hypothetical protein